MGICFVYVDETSHTVNGHTSVKSNHDNPQALIRSQTIGKGFLFQRKDS